jgi:hypothetical protein
VRDHELEVVRVRAELRGEIDRLEPQDRESRGADLEGLARDFEFERVQESLVHVRGRVVPRGEIARFEPQVREPRVADLKEHVRAFGLERVQVRDVLASR